MSHKIEQMLLEMGPLYDSGNDTVAKTIRDQDDMIKRMHLDVKMYLARLGQTGLDEVLDQRSIELASMSSNLNSALDAIARVMLELAKWLDAQKLQFSTQGHNEITGFSDLIHSNVQLALNVMMNQNSEEARELFANKKNP